MTQFEKWDNDANTADIAKGIDEASKNQKGEFAEVPHGNYDVDVRQMELKASKQGNPMVSIQFRILEGNFKGQMIFYNQVVNEGFQVHFANEILRKLVSEIPDGELYNRIDKMKERFSYKEYGNLILDIFEAINGSFEYILSYQKGKKNAKTGDYFSTYDITEVFTLVG